MNTEDIKESLKYIRDVFPQKALFNKLVNEGADGDEAHLITGDDLAGACYALSMLMDEFNVKY